MRSATDKGAGRDENELSAENAFFTNLLLLRFDPQKEEKKHGIPFHPNMFITSNAKGMQAVLYFLFCRLSADQAKKAFKNCWPIIDQRSQGAEFKKQAFMILSQLEKDGRLPSNTVRLSHLQTCCGERLVVMLWHLSTLVLRKVMQRKYPNYHIPPIPSLDQSQLQNAHVTLRAAKLHTIQQRRKFVAQAQKVVATQQQWKEYAQSIENDYRNLTVELNEAKEGRKRLDARMDKQLFSKERTALRETKKKDVQRIWALLSSHQEANSTMRELMNDILNKRVNENRIDGAELQAKILPFLHLVSSSQLAKQLTPKELEDLRSINPIVNDKLDLVALIKVWNLVLGMLKRRIQMDEQKVPAGKENLHPKSELERLAPSVKEQLDAHRHHLENIRKLNKQLQQEIPDIKENISVLKEKVAPFVKQKDARNNPLPSPSPRATPFGSINRSLVTPAKPQGLSNLQLVPPTPLASFSPDFMASGLEDGGSISPVAFDTSDTPMREQQIMRSVRRAAKHVPLRTKGATTPGAENVVLQLSRREVSSVLEMSPKDESQLNDTGVTDEIGTALSEFSPLHSMDFREMFSPLSIQKKSRFSTWVDFGMPQSSESESEFEDLTDSTMEKENKENKESEDTPELDGEEEDDVDTAEKETEAKEETREGDRTALDVLAKELVEDFFSDDIFAISGTNYGDEVDAFADLLQSNPKGSQLFNKEREDMLENDFEDLEDEPEKEQHGETGEEMNSELGEIDSDFSEIFEDQDKGRRKTQTEDMESSVKELRREMKKEAQRRVSKCFDFDLDIDWEEEEPKKPAKMEDLEEDVMAELDAIEKLDSEDLNLSESGEGDSVHNPSEGLESGSHLDLSHDKYEEDFGYGQPNPSVEASPFTQLIMEERRRLAAEQVPMAQEEFNCETENRQEEIEEDEDRGVGEEEGLGDELVLSLSVDKQQEEEEEDMFDESAFAATILKDDDKDAAAWDEFLLASVKSKRTRSMKDEGEGDGGLDDLLTPVISHHLRLGASNDPVTPSFFVGTPSVPRKLSFSSPESMTDTLGL